MMYILFILPFTMNKYFFIIYNKGFLLFEQNDTKPESFKEINKHQIEK